MDFKKLDIGIETAAPRPATVHDFTPVVGGKNVQNGAGEDLVLSVVSLASPEGQRDFTKIKLKYGEAEGNETMGEEELDELLKKHERMGVELSARMVKGWNLKYADGKSIECSMENKLGFFSHFEVLGVMVMNEVMKASQNLKN